MQRSLQPQPARGLRAALDSRLANRAGCIQFAQTAPLAGTQSPRVFVGSVVLGTGYRQPIVSRAFDAVELQSVLVSERRQDLPDAPLKLDVALDNLIAQLTRGAVRVPAKP